MNYTIYRIGFNGNDETEFDVEKGTVESEMIELLELFGLFLQENPSIVLKTVDYIEYGGNM